MDNDDKRQVPARQEDGLRGRFCEFWPPLELKKGDRVTINIRDGTPYEVLRNGKVIWDHGLEYLWDPEADGETHSRGAMAMIEIHMPYEPQVSVNSWKMRSGRIKSRPRKWLKDLRLLLGNALAHPSSELPPVMPPVSIGIEIVAPRGGGRLPDATNFIKPIFDIIAAALECDDQQFTVWAEQSPPARRARPDEEPGITVRVREDGR